MKFYLIFAVLLFGGITCSAEGELKVMAGFRGHSEKPFSFWSVRDKEPQGLDPDLLRLIGKELKLKVSFYEIDRRRQWKDVRREVLVDGLVDAVAYVYTVTEERKKHISFTTPYFNSSMKAIVLKSSKIFTNKDLKGLPVLAFTHTTGYQWAVKHHKGKIVTGFPQGFKGSINDLIKQQIVSAYIGDVGILEAMAVDDQALRVIKEPIMSEDFAIAVSKKNGALLNKINQALLRLKAQGELDRLRQKYFTEKKK